MNRPFPAVHRRITQNQNNIGKLIYDSAQFVLNKRFVKGVTVNASYTYVPRWTEIGGYVDAVSGLLNEAPYFSQRKHRITASGVWELPWFRDRAQHRRVSPRRLVGGADAGLPVRPAVGHARQRRSGAGSRSRRRSRCEGKKEGQFIYGVKPCIGQRNATTGNYDLLALSTAYGCTEPYFLIRETFQRRTAMNRYDEFRRPVVLAGGRELREDDADHGPHPASGASRGVQPLQQPAVRRACSTARTPTSADFGRINRNTTAQSNFQRFVQLGFRLIF